MTTTVVPRDPVQRHIVRTLVGTQVLGGVGLSAGIAVGALLAEDVSGSAEFAGLGGTFQVLGAALIAIPMSRLMAARGRRPGLVLGYGLAAVGAVGLITAGVVRSFPLLLVASVLFGGATASNSQSRYAAADLALPAHRARDLSIVVWATTVGSVIGPNLAGPSAPLARSLGLPELTGPFLFSLVGLLLAITLIVLRLRPDPLVEARRRSVADGDPSGPAHGSVTRGLRVAAAIPAARLGLVTMALGHVTMVSVMVMTPLHMSHGDAGLEVIGFVISIHILGMFAFSPLTGLAVDRFGGRAVAVLGSVVLSAAALLALGVAGGGVGDARRRSVPARARVVVHPRRGVHAAHGGRPGARAAGCAGGVRPGHGPHGRGRWGARRAGRRPRELRGAGAGRPGRRRDDRPRRSPVERPPRPSDRLTGNARAFSRSQEHFAQSGSDTALSRRGAPDFAGSPDTARPTTEPDRWGPPALLAC